MKKQHRRWAMGLTATITLGLLAEAPTALAATSPIASQQNLTSLGSLSTQVTGLPDSTFMQQESAYQGSITGQSGWRGFSHQTGRDITIQFPKPVDVQHIEITALQNPQLGIYFPDYVQFEFQKNGQWYSAGKRTTALPQSGQSVSTQVFQFNQSAGVEADAVRLHIPVAIWVFVRGLKVSGSSTQVGQDPSKLTSIGGVTTDMGPLSPTAKNAHGIHNMLLVETGAYGNQGTWSANDFRPMVAYTDQSGQMTSPMFDTMLFLPYGTVGDTESALTSYLNDLFAPGQQLSALDQAVATTNTALNRPSYKEQVVLTIPNFPYGTHDFGMVNGQELNFGGSTQDPNASQARQAALQWYINSLLTRWKTANFQHLQLVGLYWNEEQYHSANPGERDYLNAGLKAAHDNGLPLFWIPFYGADQTSVWNDLGFDAAWIQPNFVEQGNAADEVRISNAMETANLDGMGIEVELTGLDAGNQDLYNTFLSKLDMEGFGRDQVTHAFYDGSKLLVTAANSTDPTQRAAYDNTAAFIQGK
ncbi:DUF4855 domain-containing protein [Alicyclobacillus dauci]|uniref:DUF4855 domain-containing protein n=1 Tax=Alicyclobacillus dauci TaxID=1475485 RepID=A0ABY6Z1F0_9BACL|nr:DUF4855 domain-containing protein [Alicyclobacillus dauci]WAH36709.1 DUF4855 domain-containing protein [Alicyclobacillus dauci]